MSEVHNYRRNATWRSTRRSIYSWP